MVNRKQPVKRAGECTRQVGMTIDSATADAVAALPTQRGSLPVTRPLPLAAPITTALPVADLPQAARWQVWAAVLAGLLGGVLMVAGIVLPW